MFDTARFVAWWRINVSGQLHLGEFLRFVMDRPAIQKGGA